jgi:hypothetical protein
MTLIPFGNITTVPILFSGGGEGGVMTYSLWVSRELMPGPRLERSKRTGNPKRTAETTPPKNGQRVVEVEVCFLKYVTAWNSTTRIIARPKRKPSTVSCLAGSSLPRSRKTTRSVAKNNRIKPTQNPALRRTVFI